MTRYTVRWAGPDDLLGNEDDKVFVPTTMTLATDRKHMVLEYPSLDGLYEFKIRGAGVDRPNEGGAIVDDTAFNWINGDGDSDDKPGGNFVLLFEVQNPLARHRPDHQCRNRSFPL